MMASTAALVKTNDGDPSERLDRDQLSKAVRALTKHINKDREEHRANTEKRSLLAKDHDVNDDTSEEGADDSDDVHIWLLLTTKTHILNRTRLKPAKILVPHTLNSSPTSSICLITADPQRPFKDVVAHPSFPSALRSRITRVIGVQKLRLKYKSYESRRQLLAEHDIFLADDRIVNQLPQVLGKVFYKTTAKRPISVSISGGKKDGQPPPKEGEKSVARPKAMAEEITRALSSAIVHLSASTSTSVRVGKASWEEKKVTENIIAVVDSLIDRLVPRKWRGVRALHIKGPNTAALPLWLAEELWVDANAILEEEPEGNDTKLVEAAPKRKKRTRDMEEGAEKETKLVEAAPKRKKRTRNTEEGAEVGKERTAKSKKLKKSRRDGGTGEKDELEKEMASRKDRLKKQKSKALAEVV